MAELTVLDCADCLLQTGSSLRAGTGVWSASNPSAKLRDGRRGQGAAGNGQRGDEGENEPVNDAPLSCL